MLGHRDESPFSLAAICVAVNSSVAYPALFVRGDWEENFREKDRAHIKCSLEDWFELMRSKPECCRRDSQTSPLEPFGALKTVNVTSMS
jgi:hypothetical protein